MNYIKSILSKLLDKYDSLQERGKSVSTRVVTLRVDKDKLFENYWAEDAYKYRTDIEEAVNYLHNNAFALVERDKQSKLLKKIILNTVNIDHAYSFLGRTPKSIILNDEITIVSSMLSKFDASSIAYKYLSNMLALLQNHQPHLSYFRTLDELALSADMANEIENNEEEILLRNFSKRKFRDSKLLENSANRLLKIFNEFGEITFSDFGNLCSKHYIVKHNGYAYIKNGLRFKINNQIIDLDNLGVEFSFPDEAIKIMEILSINKTKVITIENLTTFHYIKDNNAIIIYLGGYHNKIKRDLLQKIHNFKNDLEWYHIGDIDWGGFEIFLHLREKTHIDFKPLKMGIDELTVYKDECTPLTTEDKIRLNLLLQNPKASIFYKTIEFMLKNGYKLEQESLLFD